MPNTFATLAPVSMSINGQLMTLLPSHMTAGPATSQMTPPSSPGTRFNKLFFAPAFAAEE
jgi:hypothetical protein